MIGSYKTKLSAIAIILLFIATPIIVFADTIIEEDFESYSEADLTGQGSWSGDSSYDVSTSLPYEGTKGVVNADTSGSAKAISKTGTTTDDGALTFYFRATNNTSERAFILKEGGTQCVYMRFANDGDIEFWDGGTYEPLGTYSADTWYEVQLEWRSSDHKIRWNINKGGWTDWDTTQASWSSGLNTITLNIDQNSGECYFDYIMETPSEEEEEEEGTYDMIIYSVVMFGGVYSFTIGFDITKWK